MTSTSRLLLRSMLPLMLSLGGFASGFTGTAEAQTATAEPSVADRQAAGQAYDRATAAYLGRDYARAAPLFETAYRLAPAPAALVQAVRAYERAGNPLRAASLALLLQAQHPSDEAAQRQATTTLATASASYARINVTCSSTCTLELDGAIQGHPSFFIEAGTTHTLRATFETGNIEESVSGAAGSTTPVSLTAPPPSAETTLRHDDDAPVTAPTSVDQGGLSPALFTVGLLLTIGSGAALAWSGVDTLDGVPAYRDNPTPEGLADGQSRELRTNVLIGVTAGLALTTFIFAFVTDWDGTPSTEVDSGDPETSDAETEPAAEESTARVSPALAITPDLVYLGLQGSF